VVVLVAVVMRFSVLVQVGLVVLDLLLFVILPSSQSRLVQV
jgi:hypothetical protein